MHPPTDPDQPREARLAAAFVTLGDTLAGGHDVLELTQYLVDSAVELLDVTAAGLLLTDGAGQLGLLASSNETADLVEMMQVCAGAGPCFDCFRSGKPQPVSDLNSEPVQWPALAELASRQGFRSVHTFPMRLRTNVIGALNLFRGEPEPLTDQDQGAAQALADVATIGILHERIAHDGAQLTTRLQHASNSRVVIEQAKGLVANHTNLDMDQAFALLRGYARRHQLALTELAQDLVDRRRGISSILDGTGSGSPPTSRRSLKRS